MMQSDIHLCLSDLIDQDLSSYEYYQSLPHNIQRKMMNADLRSFQEMQDYVALLDRQNVQSAPQIYVNSLKIK